MPPSAPVRAQDLAAAACNPLDFKLKMFDLVFNEEEASIKEVTFKEHKNYRFVLGHSLLLSDLQPAFKKLSADPRNISFVYSDGQKRITKKFSFSGDAFDFWLSIIIENTSPSPLKLSLPLEVGELDFSDQAHAQFLDMVVSEADKVKHFNGRKEMLFNNVSFGGIRDKYYCAVVDVQGDMYGGQVLKINGKMSKLILRSQEMVILPQESLEKKYHIYLGPQDLQILTKINPYWSGLVNYGTFDAISHILLQLLEFIHKFIPNWGWSIIFLSVAVYFLLYPLTLKQMRSMKEMQALQPRIEALKAQYKDNPQKLNKEIMELYREHKVNPLGGCLPLVLQMPIFFALYQTLMRSIVLKGADFLWIKDLSEPDRLFLLPNSLPFIGNEINLLPVVMAGGMFFQQKISMSSAAVGTAAEQQKLMTVLFPVLFCAIFYHMPSGLVLYWLINSILSISFQIKTNRSK